MEILERLMRWLETALSWSQLGVLGTFGGIANFYYLNATKNRKFVWGVLVANAVVAFVLGKSIGSFIPETNLYRDGLVMLIGFFAFPLVHVLEAKVIGFVERILPDFGGK